MTFALTTLSAATIASLFTLRLGRLILCRMLFKLPRVALATANGLMKADGR